MPIGGGEGHARSGMVAAPCYHLTRKTLANEAREPACDSTTPPGVEFGNRLGLIRSGRGGGARGMKDPTFALGVKPFRQAAPPTGRPLNCKFASA